MGNQARNYLAIHKIGDLDMKDAILDPTMCLEKVTLNDLEIPKYGVQAYNGTFMSGKTSLVPQIIQAYETLNEKPEEEVKKPIKKFSV